MTILPTHPDDIVDDTMLARYLRGHPARLPVLNRILSLLDDDGRVGDDARHYVVKTGLRRSVLRGVLIAERIPLPSWVQESPRAATANKQFVQAYRAQRRNALAAFPNSIPAR